MSRALREDGSIAASVKRRAKGANKRTARDTGRILVENLRTVGFSEVRLASKKIKPVSVVCALGVK